MADLIPVTVYDDFECGANFVLPAQPWGVSVQLPRDKIERWQQARGAWEDAQTEIRDLYYSARAERAVGRASERHVCYVSGAGITVHVKPNCRCGSRRFALWS